jgi:hypothetical protein
VYKRQPVSYWSIQLYKTQADYSNPVLVDETTTDANGFYQFLNVIPGYYQIKEVLASGWTNLTNVFIDLFAGPEETKTGNDYVNFENATIIVHKDILDPDGNPVADSKTGFSVTLDGSSQKPISESTTATYSNLGPGTYTIDESIIPSGYVFDHFSRDDGADPGAQIKVASGETVNLYVYNKQTKATITVVKNVVAPDGVTDVSDAHIFYVTVNGTEKKVWEGHSETWSVNPGSYSATEALDADYTFVSSLPSPATVVSGGSATITVTNKQKVATVTIVKDVKDPTGADVADNYVFDLSIDDPVHSAIMTTFSENSPKITTVYPGSVSFYEWDELAYTKKLVTPDNDANPVNGTIQDLSLIHI